MNSHHLHFLGVGGVGMCGIAEVLLAEGFLVSGCDIAQNERTQRLVEQGMSYSRGHDPNHLGGVDTVVVSAAVPAGEPELEAAHACGIPVIRRAEMLAELMRMRRGVAISGTHGKTTTTALAGHLLTYAGLDPTVIVGGRAHFLGTHARVGEGPLLICEADEFDRSFLELAPHLSVVTNLEAEHLDCYSSEEDLQSTFCDFVNRSSVFGAAILCADDPGAWGLRSKVRRKVIGFGASEEANLRMRVVSALAEGTRFFVFRDGHDLGEVFLPLPGLFNALNAMAGLAVGLELGVEFAVLAEACACFTGVARRFEVRGERRGVTVVDDYAHHPTELRSVLEATRQAMPGRRVVAVFQPHLYTRTRDFAADFAAALMGADIAVVLPVYPAREQPIEGVSAQLVIDEAIKLGHSQVIAGSSQDETLDLLEDLLNVGDVLLFMGAGNVDELATAWLEKVS